MGAPFVVVPHPAAREPRDQAEPAIGRLEQYRTAVGTGVGDVRGGGQRPAEAVHHVDEVDVHLDPRIGPDWMLPGIQRLVMTLGDDEERYLAGAYDPVHQRLVYVEGDRKASWSFLNLLRAPLDAYCWERTIHLILDNSIIHESQVTQTWLRAHGARLRLRFLPPYCPDENRIERLGRDLHANVTRNRLCRTMAGLLRAVHRYLAARFELEEAIAHAA